MNRTPAQIARCAVCSWSLQPRTPAELVQQVKTLGLDAVQLALSPLVDDAGTWKGCIRTLAAHNITIVSGMMQTRGEDYSTLETIRATGGIRPDATWQANLEHARNVADIAAAAEIPLVTFHAGFLPERLDDPERAKILDRLRVLSDVFESAGVALALETGQETAEQLGQVLAELDRPNLGVNFDPANMLLYGSGDPIAALHLLAAHVRQVHIKDARASDQPGCWGEEVPVGTGQVHWSGFFQALQAMGRPVDLVIEREAGDDRMGDVRVAMAYLQRFQ